MNTKNLIFALIIIFSSFIGSYSFAEVAVIIHPSNSSALTQDDVAKIFLGKAKSFPGGESVVPINLAEGKDIRGTFDSVVLDKTASQLKSYWSKLVFTGKGTPPKEVDSEDEMKALIANNPNMIGYIDSANVDSTVKVVVKF